MFLLLDTQKANILHWSSWTHRNKRKSCCEFGKLFLWSLQLFLLTSGVKSLLVLICFVSELFHRCLPSFSFSKTILLNCNFVSSSMFWSFSWTAQQSQTRSLSNLVLAGSAILVLVRFWNLNLGLFHNFKLIWFRCEWCYCFAADPANASIITQCGGIPLIIECLSSPVTNTVSLEPWRYLLCFQSFLVHK